MQREENERENRGRDEARGLVWLLVDHSSREEALMPVVSELEARGIEVELVTITEVIGSVAREAIAGGAERILRGLRVAMRGRSGDEDLIGAFRRRQPDVLVVTEPRFVRSIGVLENLTGVASLQVGLVPDFAVDSAWFSGQLRAYIVPDEQTRQALVDEGVDAERVQLGGPALRPNFRREIDKGKVRAELGFGDEKVVLVRADGIEIATLEQLVFQATLVDGDVRFVFHHDGDGATASALRRAADRFGLAAAMFGRVADLERYFAAADAILAADSDSYLAELLEQGVATLFIPSRQGGRGNAEALVAAGFAESLDDIGQLGSRLDRFLKEENLEKLREELQGWDGGERHDRLVVALEKVVENAMQWRQAPLHSTAADEEAKDGAAAPLGGAFEPIGKGQQVASAPDDEAQGTTDDRTPGKGRDFRGISRAEAQEQLAQLILKEREQERRLQELEKQQERWQGRLTLAREWNEEDLAQEAEGILRGYLSEGEELSRDLKEIRRQKVKLKTAARGGSGSGRSGEEEGGGESGRFEERFRKMEVDRDMEGLRDRIKRELGE